MSDISLKIGSRVLDRASEDNLGYGFVQDIYSAPDAEEDAGSTITVEFVTGPEEDDRRLADRRSQELLVLPPRIIGTAAVPDPDGASAQAVEPFRFDATLAILGRSADEICALEDGTPETAAIARRLVDEMEQGDRVVIRLCADIARYFGLEAPGDAGEPQSVAPESITTEMLETARIIHQEITPRLPEASEDPYTLRQVERLLEGAEFLCSDDQGDEHETWYFTQAGQFVRIAGHADERCFVLGKEEAKDELLGWLIDEKAAAVFGWNAVLQHRGGAKGQNPYAKAGTADRSAAGKLRRSGPKARIPVSITAFVPDGRGVGYDLVEIEVAVPADEPSEAMIAALELCQRHGIEEVTEVSLTLGDDAAAEFVDGGIKALAELQESRKAAEAAPEELDA